MIFPTLCRRPPTHLRVVLMAFLLLIPGRVAGQIERPLIGAGIGIAGGAVVTISTIVARARFQHEYIDSVEDLIHWQSIPMIGAPAAGVIFGLAGKDSLTGSIIGSTVGMAAGAALGTGLGWLVSRNPESPWAGGVIGAGVGLTFGGLGYGLYLWNLDDNPHLSFPDFLRFQIVLPAPW